ncbi:HEAT repeat domain-containing protein [Alkalinema sp. FACHB-956]|uniref:HEAT repeat domain-containing protein n=1 Tax=Alkalinema sp. FACHB-956 TaxID=2692768 RepID=UPI0016849933|nr:HEAT repeat domain-containing protein [Alkalinema sp. FACHB-956]
MQVDDVRSLASIAALRQHCQWSCVLQEIQALLQALTSVRSDRRKSPPTLPPAFVHQVLESLLDVLVAGDFQTKWEAAKLFPTLGEAAIEPLLALLDNDDLDPEVHWFVVRILGHWPHPQTLQALLSCIQTHPQEEVRSMAVQVLGSQGPSALALVEDLLQAPSTRLQGVNILAQIRSPQSIPRLLTLADDTDAPVRASAIAALAMLQPPAILSRLVQALEDPAVGVRRAALVGLTFSNLTDQPTIVAQIQPRLWDVDIQVCCQAAICLGRIGSPAAVTVLRSALQSSVLPDPFALELVRSLIWIATEPALDAILQALDRGTLSASVAQETITLLGRLESPTLKPQVAQWLIERLHQQEGTAPMAEPPHPRFDSQGMISALGQLQEPIVIDGLIPLLAQADPKLRLHLVAALRRFDGVYARLQTLASQPSSEANLKQGLSIALKEW